MSDERIVISGLSGIFPNSDSILEFSENLYNNVDMVSAEPRWQTNDPEIPKHVGKISEIEKFDSQFFRVGYHQAKVLDPLTRKELEHAYGAIFDSGNTYATLKGKRIGVFNGTSFDDSSAVIFYDIDPPSNFIVSSASKSMKANRISYWADGTGPSFTMDYSCVTSTAALEKGFNSIRHGECDAAVVCCGNICSLPMLSLNLKRAGFLSTDGKTKCFDKNSDGYVRAEAVTVVFLQKAKDAKRIYAEVCNVKGEYALKTGDQFSPFRKSDDLQRFLKEVYSESSFCPEDVEYVEANGAAFLESDKNELIAIGNVFAQEKAVKVGCVKSNMGNSEGASGLTAVTKLCLAYHKGKLPGNLHYTDPLDVSSVRDGKIQILTQPTEFSRGYTALNNFSYTGANYHVLLKGHFKERNLHKYKSDIPRIVLASGRDESGVTKIFESLKSKPIDEEEIALLHNIFEKEIIGHTGRGFTILESNDQNGTASISESVDYYSGVRRPLWFVYSGMGSQWTGMGADLMRIPTFRKSIERCHKVLESRGLDIIKIITETDKTIFDNILNSFVGIGAVQIGLTDILKEMGVEPDYIIGHSLGETACAYHDDTFTAEELMLATYSRGKAVKDSDLVQGSMAAVGLGCKDLVSCCPPEIDIACHNSAQSTTISGPKDVMKKFVDKLTNQGIFAREVPSADVAYHSRYVHKAGPSLLQNLREVIKHPKLRSKKWLSTSVPKEHWDTENAKYSSPEYHTNNLLSPVLFEEVLNMIPSNAVVVEIAPHGLLQAILKRSNPDCVHIPLTKRGCSDGVKFLLEGIGKLYEAGYNPKVDTLYPKVEFPVSTETPFLSHLVQWEHSENWPVLESNYVEKQKGLTRDLVISIYDDDYSYIADNVVDGCTKIPEAALLVYVWETLAMNKQVEMKNLSIMFRDVEFHSDVIVLPETSVKLSIMISKGNDKFEISENGKLVATGAASGVKVLKIQKTLDLPIDDFDDIYLNSKDVYEIFRMRGFCYNGVLKSIHQLCVQKNCALVKWTNNWVSFLDSLMQFSILMEHYNGITKPKFILKLKISVFEQEKATQNFLNDIYHTAEYDKTFQRTRCAGVEIEGLTFADQIPTTIEPTHISNKQFVPHFATEKVNITTALEIIMQIMIENCYSREINVIKLIATSEPEVFKRINEIMFSISKINVKILCLTADKIEDLRLKPNETNVLVFENLFQSPELISDIKHKTTTHDFIVTLENRIPKNRTAIKNNFDVLSCMSDGKEILMLLRKPDKNKTTRYIPLNVEHDFSWVSRVNNELVTTNKIVLISNNQPFSGLLGFVNKLKTAGHQNISLLAIHDIHAQKFDLKEDFFQDQLEKHMSVNILKKGQWGGYYYTSCAKSVNLRSFTLMNDVPGNMNELTWAEASPRSAQKTLVQVCYAGLSLNDCHIASRDFKSDSGTFGMDFSGFDKYGDKVMGIISGGAISSSVEADPDLIWPVPDHWSLEDAATIVLPYFQAYYCLMVKTKLKRGQIVLVTGGAGALGQAIIFICLAFECTVFATVSTLAKKKMLMKLFPQLKDDNICYSNGDSVLNMVISNTRRRGCDLVINVSTGDLRMAAMKCVGNFGVFLDLSKHDMMQNKNIGMSYLEKDRSYYAVNLSNIFKPEYANDKKFVCRQFSEGIAKGIVIPLTRVVYSPTNVCKAFRFLSLRKNTGRVLLKMRDPEIMSKGLSVSPRLSYSPKDVIVVVCDENGLGIALADKLIERGASKVLLHLNHNSMAGYVNTMFRSWSKREVSVEVSSENLRTEQGCAILVKNAMKFGKVKAVFIVLDGKRDDNGVKDDFINAYNKKCSVVLNLDLASRNCVELSHFTIVASSPQTVTDEYALSVLERVCELRNELGLPALVIRYDSLAELNGPSLNTTLEAQSISTFFRSVEISLKLKYQNVLTFNAKEDNNSFCRKVAQTLGVRDIEDLENETSLLELNLNEISLNELRTTIKNSYRIDYPLENIRGLTIKSLQELGKVEVKKMTDFECGLTAFYKTIDSEETYLTQEPIMIMSTSNTKIDDNNTQLIMIPGFEGRSESLKIAAERLKMNAIGVQLSPDIEGNSIREMAEHIEKLLKPKIHQKSGFHILGYSFGVNIALELAAILEKEGQKGIVYCLDSSPDALRSHIDAYIDKLPQSELQNNILTHMYYLLTGLKNTQLKEDLLNETSFEHKVKITLRKLKNVSLFSEQFKKCVLESAHKRINLAKEYKPKIKLESQLILLKGIAHPNSDNLSEDYNLSQYTKKPIKIYKLESAHGLAHQDLRVSNIINGQK